MSRPPVASPMHLAGQIYEWSWPATDTIDRLVLADAVRCSGPAGQALTLPAFRDGENWRARLAATPGRWQWSIPTGQGDGELTVPNLPSYSRWPDGPLRLSHDRRSLIDTSGTPAFYLADTAWAVVWKGLPEHWHRYLDRRVAQGFGMLQVNLLPWRWEFDDVEGNRPFLAGDPTQPNPSYFARYDRFLTLAAERGLVTCLMLIWGGPRESLPAYRFTTEEAIQFARYAVARFAAFPMLWSLSGDGEYAHELSKWEAVGATIEATDPYQHPTTNHLPPSMNWHAAFHQAPWHDFHMLQTGHRRDALPDISALLTHYYHRQPVKACVNGEPWYEQHPSRDSEAYGPVFTAREVRYAFWASVLAGATMGHTYGSQGIWNWKRAGDSEEPLAGPQVGPTWEQALDHPGAEHCGIGTTILGRLTWWSLQPAADQVQLDPPPATYADHPIAAAILNELLVIYLPNGALTAILKGLAPGAWQAYWINPRNGRDWPIGPVEPGFDHKWRAPAPPSDEDWLLVVERG